MSKKADLAKIIAAAYQTHFGYGVKDVMVTNGKTVIGTMGGLIIISDDGEAAVFSTDMTANPHLVALEVSWMSHFEFLTEVAEPHCHDVKTKEVVFGDGALDTYLSNRRQETILMMTEIAAENQAAKQARGDTPEIGEQEEKDLILD